MTTNESLSRTFSSASDDLDIDVSEYDYFADYVEEPKKVWTHLREACPVAFTNKHFGHHMVAPFADVEATLRDADTFSSAYGVSTTGPLLDEPKPVPHIPLEIDPPALTAYRRIVNAPMSPPAVARVEGDAFTIAHELFDRVAGQDELDYCRDFTMEFPQAVTMLLIGVPLEDLAMVRPWLDRIMLGPATHPDYPGAAGSTHQYLKSVLERRRHEEPRDDVVGALLSGDLEGRELSDDERVQMLTIVLIGALGTTMRTLNECVRHLATRPDHVQSLRENPDLWSTAVEEFLRFGAGVQSLGRTAVKETEIAGCPIRKHDRVRVLLGSANFDPREFDKPDEMTLDRAPNRHVAFGAGPHRCVGRHVARLMIRVAMQTLLDRVSHFELSRVDPVEYYPMETGTGIGKLRLRVQWADAEGV